MQSRLLVFGANTDVGKTVVSCGLIRAACRRFLKQDFLYLKPLQTGSDEGHSDERTVRRACDGLDQQRLRCSTLFAWGPAVSPHVAHGKSFDDEKLVELIGETVKPFVFSLTETAGGVMSPGASGVPQANIYGALAKDHKVLLVGDGKLGGISTSLTALEALENRNFSVPYMAIIETDEKRYGNTEYLQRVKPTLHFPPLPKDPAVPLTQWYKETDHLFDDLLTKFI